MTDRGKAIRVGQLCKLMEDPANWGMENHALDIAYSIGSPRIRNRALEKIADALTKGEKE